MTIEDKILNIFTNTKTIDTNIFQDRTVFDIYYTPNEFKYRDNQIQTIADNISPCLYGNGPINTIILGDYATGKTTATKKLFELINNTTEEIHCVYINCKTYNTQYKVYTVIYHAIFGYDAPTRGVASTNLFNRMMRKLSKTNKALVVALDDINYLFKNKEGYEVLYTLLRAYETFNVRVGIIGIKTGFTFDQHLPPSIQTVFIPQEIIFGRYSFEQIYDILKARCLAGFQPRCS